MIFSKILSGGVIFFNRYRGKFQAALRYIHKAFFGSTFYLSLRNQLLPKNIADLAFNKTYTLTIPTYEKSGQAVHPDILYDAARDNPNFILVFTPYPYSNDHYENPSMLISSDGLRFFEEFPHINPLASAPPFDHNNDPDIFYYENRLNIIYLETLRPEKQNLMLLSSPDRETWDSRIVNTDYLNRGDPMIVSPCYALINNGSYLYYVNISDPTFRIQYVKVAKNFAPHFNQREDIDIQLKNNNPWHIDVFSSKNCIYMLICCVSIKNNKKKYNLHIARSINGRQWELSETMVLHNAYRSTGFISNDNIYIYYSRQNAVFSNWEIGIVRFKINKFFADNNRPNDKIYQYSLNYIKRIALHIPILKRKIPLNGRRHIVIRKYKEEIKFFFKKNISNSRGNFYHKKKIDNLVVSLTSFPERIDLFEYTLFSLINQTIGPNKIILWLSEEEFEEKQKSIPKSLSKYHEFDFEIRFVKENYKSYKKLVYALKKYSDNLIVTADDDIYYPPDWLELLYSYHINYPRDIIAHRVHNISFKDRHIDLYRNWNGENRDVSFLNFPTTGGGVLFPPDSLYHDAIDSSIFLKLCPSADDIWFYVMAILKKTKIRRIKNGYQHCIEFDYTLNRKYKNIPRLWEINRTENNNQLNHVFDYYDLFDSFYELYNDN
jgi:hypothetical protein